MLRHGLCAKQAWKVTNHIRVSELEALIWATLFAVLVLWVGLAAFTDYAKTQGWRYQVISRQAAYYKHNTITLEQKLHKLELVIIGCLNGKGVILAGRNKQCIIKEYKEAIS